MSLKKYNGCNCSNNGCNCSNNGCSISDTQLSVITKMLKKLNIEVDSNKQSIEQLKIAVSTNYDMLMSLLENEIDDILKNEMIEIIDEFLLNVNDFILSLPVKPIERLGLRLNVDDTEKFKEICSSYPDTIIFIPSNNTIILSDFVDVTTNNTKFIFGYNSGIKIADNSGVLNQTKAVIPSIFRFLGYNSGMVGGFIDGNIENNYLTIGGVKYSGHYGGVAGVRNIGVNLVSLRGEKTFVKNTKFINASWSAVILGGELTDNSGYVDNSVRIDGRIVEDCLIINSGRDSISVQYSKNALIRNNKIVNPMWHAIHDYRFCDNSLIVGNEVFKDKETSVKFYPTQPIVNIDALISNHDVYTDSLVYNTTFKFNKVAGDINIGILIHNFTDSVNIINNTVKAIYRAIQLSALVGINNIKNNELSLKESNTVNTSILSIGWNSDLETYLPSYDYNKNSLINLEGNIYSGGKQSVYHISTSGKSLLQSLFLNIEMDVKNEIITPHNTDIANYIITHTNNPFNSIIKFNIERIRHNNLFNIVFTRGISADVNKIIFNNTEEEDKIYYVSSNGDDTFGVGSLSSPFKTINQVLNLIRKNPTKSYVIRLLTNIPDDIVLENINNTSIHQLVIEGVSSNGDSSVVRDVGNISIKGCAFGYLKYLKPTKVVNSNLFLNELSSLIRLENVDFTHVVEDQDINGVRSDNCSNLYIVNNIFSGKQNCVTAYKTSKITVVNSSGEDNVNVFRAYGGIIMVNSIGSIEGANLYSTFEGGIYVKPNGSINS